MTPSVLPPTGLGPHQTSVSQIQSFPDGKAVVVGLYGVSGSGKSFLLSQLKYALGCMHFAFYDGSEMISALVPGGLEEFKGMEEQQKVQWRQRAMERIEKDCTESGKLAVVTGHSMFWSQEKGTLSPVYTETDLKTYTHILYLDIPDEIIERQRLQDTKKDRPHISRVHLHLWQQEEKTHLRSLCYNHNILFMRIFEDPSRVDKVATLLHDFRSHTANYNLRQAQGKLDNVIFGSQDPLKTVLVMDADRTLAEAETGTLFWKKFSESNELGYEADPLKPLFGSKMGYTYTAFRQAMLLYEEALDDQKFDALCQDIASEVIMHSDFVSLLHLVAQQKDMGMVVITCGLRRVWYYVLEREGLSKSVTVIGGGRVSDDIVISPAVKAALVSRLQKTWHTYVWAFGDSPLDVDMLREADQAVVVVGREGTRSTTMDAALSNAIDHQGLEACQVLLPDDASQRLDSTRLPIIKLTGPDFVRSLVGTQSTDGDLQVIDATDTSAARLLATPMRDAGLAGPGLREAHRRAGWYLAMQHVADIVGLEPSPIQHVLGHESTGSRLLHEQQTTIVALMRGGEPMARGVNDAFPLAMFVHAKEPDELKPHHLHGQITLILVDSVINTGKSIIEFVERIRNLHATVRIVILAGVVQDQCISHGTLKLSLFNYPNIHLVALRTSGTKFTGSGTTDTGNRLFNTTHLP